MIKLGNGNITLERALGNAESMKTSHPFTSKEFFRVAATIARDRADSAPDEMVREHYLNIEAQATLRVGSKDLSSYPPILL